ncbi:MAG: hypothetical protein V7606_1933 [Burkholderiales bacterium]
MITLATIAKTSENSNSLIGVSSFPAEVDRFYATGESWDWYPNYVIPHAGDVEVIFDKALATQGACC